MIWLIPMIIPKIVNIFSILGNMKKSFIYGRAREISSKELLCICTLLLFSCSTIFRIVESSTNSFFQITKISKNSTPYILRHSYQNFISNWKNSDIKFNDMLKVRAEREEAELFDDYVEHKYPKKYPYLEAKYFKLDRISKKLLSKTSNINEYDIYGEEILFNNDDFLNSFGMKEIFILPSIFKQYIFFLLCILVLSLFPSKKKWPLYTFLISFICILSETTLLFYPLSNIPLGSFERFFWNRELTTQFDQVNILRNIIFLIMSVIVVFFDFKVVDIRDVPSKLQSSLLSLQSSIAKLQMLKFFQSLPKTSKITKSNTDHLKNTSYNNSELLIMKSAIKNRLKSIDSGDEDFFDNSFFENYFKVK